MNRPDLADFEVGSIYRQRDTDELVEFVGVATMGELAGEDVAVFRFLEMGGALVATMRSYSQGEIFEPVGDAVVGEIEEEQL